MSIVWGVEEISLFKWSLLVYLAPTKFQYFIQIKKIVYLQGVPGGMDKTSGECSLG